MLRRLAIITVTVLAVVVAALPIVLTLVFGWQHTTFLASALGRGAGIYFILAVVYAVWLPATVVGLVAVYDRLGVHYTLTERPPRKPAPRDRLRRRAAAKLAQADRPTNRER